MLETQKRIKLMAKIEVLEDTIQHYMGLKKGYERELRDLEPTPEVKVYVPRTQKMLERFQENLPAFSEEQINDFCQRKTKGKQLHELETENDYLLMSDLFDELLKGEDTLEKLIAKEVVDGA